MIDQVKQRLVARGLTIVENVPIPQTDKQIVLMEAPQLQQARTIYAFANPMAKWLIVLVAALYLAALLLSRRRPRMTVIIGAVLAANALLVALALSVGRQLFVNELAGTVFGPASRVFYDQLLSYLQRGQQVLLWLGLILVVVGWFAGGSRTGSRRPRDRGRRSGNGGLLARRRSRLGCRPVGRGQRRLAADRRRVSWAQSSCCGATMCLCPGCSGPRCWWPCCWLSSRFWSGAGGSSRTRAPASTSIPQPVSARGSESS